jgi:DNA-binding IscR family transcriptional regulator
MLSTSQAFRAVLAAPDLSLAAKGLMAYVVTRPPGVVITKAELFQASSDPMPTIEQATRELVRLGLVGTVPGRGRGNRQSGGITLHPQPDNLKRMTMTSEH